MPAGRPSTYDPDIAGQFCSALADGAKLSDCASWMPKWSTVWQWMRSNEEFAEAYAQARQIRAERWVFEIEEITDEPAHDMASVSRIKVRTDNRKWLLSKLLPKQYGDKVGVEVSGSIDLLALVEASMKVRGKDDESPSIEHDMQHACDMAEKAEAEQQVKSGRADE